MPYAYAIGQSFHEASRSLVRAVELTPPCRYFAQRDSSGYITLPTLDNGSSYVEVQGIRSFTPAKSDTNTTFRLLGDGGWMDSRKTGNAWQAAVSAFLMRAIEQVGDAQCPTFRGDWEEGYKLVEKARRAEDTEIYIEFLQELGQSNGDWIYDFTGANVSVQNLRPEVNPENLTQVSYEMIARGDVITGLYNAGSTPLEYGGLQSGFLPISPSSGPRRFATDPADNEVGHTVGSNLTITYTSNGTVPLANLVLAYPDGFRVENAATGVAVPAAVSLNDVTGVVSINPAGNLAGGTIYRIRAVDGALVQLVDASGDANPAGVRRSLQGFVTSFRTT